MSFINTFVMKLWNWYKGHEGVADAHHTKYTDAEVDAIVAVHRAIADAHHTKYTDTEAISAVNTDDKYLKKDGTEILTADWDIGDTRKLLSDEIRARDAAGLKLYDDGGKGIFVEDGGNVGVGNNNPMTKFRVSAGTNEGMVVGTTNYPAWMGTNGLYVDGQFLASGYLVTTNKYISWGTGRARIQGVSDGSTSNLGFFTGEPTMLRRMTITDGGDIGIGTYTTTAKLDVNSDVFRLRTAKTPATSGAAGNQGDWCWDADYVYVCVATNTWKRAALSTW